MNAVFFLLFSWGMVRARTHRQVLALALVGVTGAAVVAQPSRPAEPPHASEARPATSAGELDGRYLKADYVERLERALPGLAQATSAELFLPEHPYLRRIVVWGECDRPWAMRGWGKRCGASADSSLLGMRGGLGLTCEGVAAPANSARRASPAAAPPNAPVT